ncbi:MAG: hypothetical protein AAF741_08865 [Bacteroidota bacterium]
MSQTELDTLKAQWRKQLETQTVPVLESLSDLLPPNRAKSKQISILAARGQRILDFDINRTLPTGELEVLRNQLLNDLLLFVQYLRVDDFSENAPSSVNYRNGHMLYQIPNQMEKGKRYECRVRIAEQIQQLLSDLKSQDFIKTETILVAQVMEVEIIDPSTGDNPAFDLLLLSDTEQFVDEYNYTEWLFLVRALLPGEHELYIRVSVLFEIDGKERQKNVVVNRAITVYTDGVVADGAPPAFTQVLEEKSFTTTREDKAFSPTEVGGGVELPPGQSYFDSVPEPAPAPELVEPQSKQSSLPWIYIIAVILIGMLGLLLMEIFG